MPIENKAFDRIFRKLRSGTGTILLPATDMRRTMLPYRNEQYLLTLVADQAPAGIEQAYWLDFFGRPTPFVRSPERGARIANIPVLFVNMYKTRRGYYRARLELGAENPAQLPEGELTRRYASYLERTIRQEPTMWLWSHNRWKKQWSQKYEKNWIGQQGHLPRSVSGYNK
jgi:KDO2-lipid IV(A) lauroyltransferase